MVVWLKRQLVLLLLGNFFLLMGLGLYLLDQGMLLAPVRQLIMLLHVSMVLLVRQYRIVV